MLTGNLLETKEAGRFLFRLPVTNSVESTFRRFFMLQWPMKDRLTGKQQ
jgi:hypothetical protein